MSPEMRDLASLQPPMRRDAHSTRPAGVRCFTFYGLGDLLLGAQDDALSPTIYEGRSTPRPRRLCRWHRALDDGLFPCIFTARGDTRGANAAKSGTDAARRFIGQLA